MESYPTLWDLPRGEDGLAGGVFLLPAGTGVLWL